MKTQTEAKLMTYSTMTLKAAKAIAGSLGKPSKMPGYAYGLPAAKASWVPQVCAEQGLPVPPKYGCAIGGKMAGIAGTTCASCYADGRGQYGAPSVLIGQVRRLVGVYDPRWTAAMIRLISHYVKPSEPFFRWHDSGDILSDEHLEAIATIAVALPWVNFWVPTREAPMVARFLRKHGAFPSNLTVRISATKVDHTAGQVLGQPTSTVHDKAAPLGHACPAPDTGGRCDTCRACWSPKVANVSYGIH